MTIYVMCSTDWAQCRLRDTGEQILEKVLGTDVCIESVNYYPFNRISIDGVVIKDDYGVDAFKIKAIDARFELADLIFRGKYAVDYAVVEGLEASLYRNTPDDSINIQQIIDRLSGNKQSGEKKYFKLRINNVELLDSRISYDVKSEPVDSGRFNVNHVALNDLHAVVHAPTVSSDGFGVRLRKLGFEERSGFRLDNLTMTLRLTPEELKLSKFSIDLPQTHLAFDDVTIGIDGLNSLKDIGRVYPVDIQLEEDSHIYPPDLGAFVPVLSSLDYDFPISLSIGGVLDSIDVRNLSLSSDNRGINVGLKGRILNITNPQEARLVGFDLNADATTRIIRSIGSQIAPSFVRNPIVQKVGNLAIKGSVNGSLSSSDVHMLVDTQAGDVTVAGRLGLFANKIDFDGKVTAQDLMLGTLLDNPSLGELTLETSLDGSLSNKNVDGNTKIEIDKIDFKGYRYENIDLTASKSRDDLALNIESFDPNLNFRLDAYASVDGKKIENIEVGAVIKHIVPDTLHLYTAYPDHALSGNIRLRGRGESLGQLEGVLEIRNLAFLDPEKQGIRIKNFDVDIDNYNKDFGTLSISSDILNGQLEGEFDLEGIVPDVKDMVCEIFPDFISILGYGAGRKYGNNFSFDFNIDNALAISRFFKLPVQLTDPINITGELSDERGECILAIDAPWLLQTDKIIENTNLLIDLNSNKKELRSYVSTLLPTQKGPMNLIATINGHNNQLQTNVDWDIMREVPIDGSFNFITTIIKNFEGELGAKINFQPGTINFGDEAWKINEAEITLQDKCIHVKNFDLQSQDQEILIDGVVSADPDDKLLVNLKNIELINIFETLDIDKALICGSATGEIEVSKLFTDTPDIHSNSLYVKDMGYNYCVLGDGDIQVVFNNEKQSFDFDAVITDEQGHVSQITGGITPASEELDFVFKANHIKVGFMQPYMEAFCGGIEGYATGEAHLFGTFKLIDLEGDIYADSLRIKIDFTNTWYHTSCPIHLRPGEIDVPPTPIYDDKNDIAMLTGKVWHKYFKEPSFDFKVTDARNFLCYDVKKPDSPRWYGTIYGNGYASVDGEPGIVNISATMTTTDNTIFTFELSDMEFAEEYSFINFRDLTPQPVVVDSLLEISTQSIAQQIINGLVVNEDEDIPTNYNMDINVDITPSARVEIVMDPIGGDKIVCWGKGNMRLKYGSLNDVLELYGDYTLERGTYGFTLQDLIFRDFAISENSNIHFNGDPYAGQLDIKATFTVSANLSDLDESFLKDKELNRTKVPVKAVMNVTGNMLQPDISFGLDFPTVSDDVKRKVMSIVSTDDMMNMQIIYLLALNRFYTPDYMSTTKGNGLFSVASSTISSQLSSMLGKLSDNWSIAPNLRSDRGDFSDLEVDLTLQSNLLNNRLLFNGNLGYRDKSLNNNRFVGDFDLEYLINPSGTFRLKTYNRFNDQNYYLRTAQTTQGIGFVVKRDFDKLFNFLKPKSKLLERSVYDSLEMDSTRIITRERIKSLVQDSVPTP